MQRADGASMDSEDLDALFVAVIDDVKLAQLAEEERGRQLIESVVQRLRARARDGLSAFPNLAHAPQWPPRQSEV
jgi:hypothetical protein